MRKGCQNWQPFVFGDFTGKRQMLEGCGTLETIVKGRMAKKEVGSMVMKKRCYEGSQRSFQRKNRGNQGGM